MLRGHGCQQGNWLVMACQKLFNFASSKSIWFYVEHVIPYVEGYNLEGGPVNIVWGPVETFLNVEP